ncbi:MAG: hypothetical protein HY868_26720 [Chloroflexi bacterium]|nr:hypothetical protein [Chloroflexota bacterium]
MPKPIIGAGMERTRIGEWGVAWVRGTVFIAKVVLRRRNPDPMKSV